MNRNRMAVLLLMILLSLIPSVLVHGLDNQDHDLLGFWILDEPSNQMVDYKDNGRQLIQMLYNGNLQQQTALTPFSTFSLGFLDSSGHVAVSNITTTTTSGDTNWFNKTTGFTVSCWCDRTDTTTDDGCIGTSGTGSRGWQLRHSTDPNVFCRGFKAVGSMLAVKNGAFYNGMYTCIFNVTGVFLYINETLQASVSDSGDIARNDQNLTIGASGKGAGVIGATNTPFKGDIDECSIWNRTLTQTEISSLYTSGVDIVQPTIINSSWNVTSSVFTNAIRTNWNSGGVVNISFPNITASSLSFTVTTSLSSNMSCSLTEGNYSEMVSADPLHKSATTETTSHSYVLSDNFTSEGSDCVYCSFSGTDGFDETASGVSHSGCLSVYVNTYPVNTTLTTPKTSTTISGLNNFNWTAFSDANIVLYQTILTNEGTGMKYFMGNTTKRGVSFNVSTVPNGTEYNYTVRAFDSFGESVTAFNTHISIVTWYPNATFFNGTIQNFTNPDNEDSSPFTFYYNVSGKGNLNLTGVCSLFVNSTAVLNITPVAGNNSFPNIPLSEGNYTINVSCTTGFTLNNPQNLTLLHTNVVIPNSTTLFNFYTCPSTTPAVLMYSFFVVLFIALYILGFALRFPIISFCSGLVILGISITTYTCIGAIGTTMFCVISILLIVASVFAGGQN